MANKKRTGSLTRRYKKQHGLHHPHNGKYLKVYWPYLPIFLFVLGGIGLSIAVLVNKPTSQVSVSGISATNLLSQTNNYRQSNSLNPLQVNNQLATAAQEKANDMAIHNYWSPISPSGQTPWQVVKSTGYTYSNVGENLAYGFIDPNTLMSTWLKSPSHKALIINNAYTDIGFGIVQAPNYLNQGPQTIIVALYGSKGGTSISNTSSAFTSASLTRPSSQTITKAESITSLNNPLTIFISGLLIGAITYFLIFKHAFLIRKWAVEGEELVIKHPGVDLFLVIFLIGIASLNQTIGIIG